MATDTRDFPLTFAWRVEMARELASALPEPELPRGMLFVDFRPVQLPKLARVEHRAFAGGADAKIFREHLQNEHACQLAWKTRRDFDPRTSVVLQQGAEPVGFVRAGGARGVAVIDCVAVVPELRGGTGRALMLEALRRMRALRFEVALLTVTAENATAVRLYERLGFREVGWSMAVYRR
ncbi:MAG: GNAT family N-acetyltransferase [Deltaproteobacteria bacterium]|nr:GNAT family N-acetyltransferase [Deltaproteobacteria bacterium]